VGGGILITGAGGFIGSRLLATLSARGADVTAGALDLTDAASVGAAVGARPWDAIFHLAAESHVGRCEADPASAYRVNLGGTCLLLDAIAARAPGAHLVFASTAQVYAPPSAGQDAVIDEAWAILPGNVYARTKWRAELAVRDLASREGLRATILRLFNHTHRAQSPDFFLPSVHRELSREPRADPVEVRVGNLDLKRDIGAVSDAIAALEAVLERPPPAGEARTFNVCSGTAKSLRDLAERLAARLGVRARFVVDPARLRPGEAVSICGSHARLTAATGWTPRVHGADELIDSFLSPGG
jgi:GDP-4-dehydro-6-deoxy-D-mannose reductase